MSELGVPPYSNAELAAIINAKGAVAFGSKIYTTVASLPTDSQIATILGGTSPNYDASQNISATQNVYIPAGRSVVVNNYINIDGSLVVDGELVVTDHGSQIGS